MRLFSMRLFSFVLFISLLFPFGVWGADSSSVTPTAAITASSSDGTVRHLGNRYSGGPWTLTGLTVGKPVVIGVSSSQSGDVVQGEVFMRVLSGSAYGGGPQYFGLGMSGVHSSYAKTPSVVIVPTSTTLRLDVLNFRAGVHLVAYQ